MGRHAARFVPIVFLAGLAVVASSCGALLPDDGAPMGSADGEPCPESITQAEPVELAVGVVQEHADDGTTHVLCDVGYAVAPPTSGSHFPVWQSCGFYTEPIRDETAVHALEHGAVWIAYDPDLSGSEVDGIEALVSTDSHYLASPYPGLKNPIVLSAWRRQVAVDSITDPAVAAFAAAQLGRVSETAPEAGVTCESQLGRTPSEPDAGYAELLAQLAN